MSDQVFCYHCRRHHSADQLIQVDVRGIKRWRCRRSIALSRASAAARDAFGRAASELNRALRSVRPLPHPVLEVFNAAGPAA
jgi:hypothetical protein